jgi:hypothetical protein
MAIGSVWGANTWGANTWGANTWGDAAESVGSDAADINTRMFEYLAGLYPGDNDLTSMMTKNLASRTGSMNDRYKALMADATA